MKREILRYSFLIILFMGAIAHSSGQETLIRITFKAIFNDESLRLDSITVKNVTRDLDTVLYYPDTILLLNEPEGIETLPIVHPGIMAIHPNPSGDHSIVTLRVVDDDWVVIRVTDARGNTVFLEKFEPGQGEHRFRFIPPGPGIFLVTARGKTEEQTVKLLSTGPAGRLPVFEPESSLPKTGEHGSMGRFPSFSFSQGDSLRYIGYVDKTPKVRGSAVCGSRPFISDTILFMITEGIPCAGIPCLEYAGKSYQTVQIGDHCWFRENLASGQFSNGDVIPEISDAVSWSGMSGPGSCFYNNDQTMGLTYGRLYNGYAVSETRNLCPTGWHVPRMEDWEAMMMFLGVDSSHAGGYLKEYGNEHWAPPNTGSYNTVGFTALPGGRRTGSGVFYSAGYYGYWWTPEASGKDEFNQSLFMWYDRTWLSKESWSVNSGLSVRCVKDP